MKQYLIQINYKSGHWMEFWCDEFHIKANGAISWVASDPNFRPVSIADNVSDIESVWQINMREVPDKVAVPEIEE